MNRSSDFSNHISDTKVNAFAQDQRGYIWIGTARGLNRYNGSSYQQFYSFTGDNSLVSDNILDLEMDSNGTLWISSEYGMSYMRDGQIHHYETPVYNLTSRILELDKEHIVALGKDGFVKFTKDPIKAVAIHNTIGTSWVENVVVTANKELWFTMEKADSCFVCALNSDLRLKFRSFLGKNLEINDICEDILGNIWIASSRGLIRYDSRSGSHLPLSDGLERFKGKVHFVKHFHSNNLLIGAADDGLYDYNLLTYNLSHIVIDQSLPRDGEFTCFVDREDNIWLSDNNSDPYMFCSARPFQHLNPEPHTKPRNGVTNIFFDRQGYMWALKEGVMCSYVPGSEQLVWSYDDDTHFRHIMLDKYSTIWAIEGENTIMHFRLDRGKAAVIEQYTFDKDIFRISERSDDKLIITSVRGFYELNPKSEDLSMRWIQADTKFPFVFTCNDSRSGRIFLFAVNHGISELKEDDSIVPINEDKYVAATDFLIASDGSYWIGFSNRGVVHYDPESGKEELFDAKSGLVDLSVKSLLEDKYGNIWIATREHITKYDTRNRKFVVVHDDRFGGSNQYNISSCAIGANGKIYFGGISGITEIDPYDELVSRNDIPLFLESIRVNDVKYDEDTEKLELTKDKNTISLRFGAVMFNVGNGLNYSYMMEGYDHDWTTQNNGVSVTYANLPPGSYTFRARVRNYNGSWSPSVISLPITIKQSPWLSTLAKTIYLILIALILLVTGLIFEKMRRQKQAIRMAEEKENLNKEHLKFMTNIAHEFKTPLALIYAPIRELSEMIPESEARLRNLIDIINNNAFKLKNLSDEIFAMAKGEEKGLVINKESADLCLFIQKTVDEFQAASLRKGIVIENRVKQKNLVCLFDPICLGKILSNLLGNAVKYCSAGCVVKVSLEQSLNHISIIVEDDGPGIIKEKAEHLFDRFERLGAERSVTPGSGIGLNYAKSLSYIMGGDLSFSAVEPHGASFKLRFPFERSAVINMGSGEVGTKPETGNDKGCTILIVEDNPDMLSFLGQLLGADYNIILCPDAVQAAEVLKNTTPDLVLSDVMMPLKSGTELCEEIKTSEHLLHIPVVLLSAKSDVDSSVKGLGTGADAYIGKPFEPDFLLAQIESLLKNRSLIQHKLLNITSTSVIEEAQDAMSSLSDAEKEFLQKLHSYMDLALDDEKFGASQLARQMNMSYSSLYAKIKDLTGSTPASFINTYRMNKALEMLKTGRWNVGEVAYKVGSSSPNTFSREFKKQFGYPPSKAIR